MRSAVLITVLAFTARGHANDLVTHNAPKHNLVAKLLDNLCKVAHKEWPLHLTDIGTAMLARHSGHLAFVQSPSKVLPGSSGLKGKVSRMQREKAAPAPNSGLQRACASMQRSSPVARAPSSIMSVVKANAGPIAGLRTTVDLLWYTLYHSWRTWYFTTLFLLGYMSAARFDPKQVIALFIGHPAFYLTFFAISKSVYDVDWNCIADGTYKMPYDAELRSTLQWMRPDRMIAYCKDARAIADRAARDGYNELPANPRKPPSGSYPDYYLRNFHYQTDGWLSDASAAVYEVATESLFTGTQDAMQRMGLVAIERWLAKRSDTAPVELLDAGCGTGRFLCQMAHNFDNFRFTALDLSPYYLDACKRSYSELQTSSNLPPAEFLNANMEKLPLPDASKDVIVCTYVFHELPPLARQQAVKDFFRVLRPGGLCVLMDSVQEGDLGPDRRGTLQWFPRTFHEPYYMTWLDLDLRRLFQRSGFKLFGSSQRHVSKMAAFLKPEA